MKLFFLFIILFLPSISHASSLSKQEACAYRDGIHREEVYVYWPGKQPQIDEFLKYDGKLYYFIQVLPDAKSLGSYRKAWNSPYTDVGFIRNSGSYFVTFDCARSKVDFSSTPKMYSTRGDQYGRLNWIDGKYLSYSFPILGSRNTCRDWPDAIMDMSTMGDIAIERVSWMPRSTKDICVARWLYKSLPGGKLQFDLETHDILSGESWYSRYMYQIDTRKLKKIK